MSKCKNGCCSFKPRYDEKQINTNFNIHEGTLLEMSPEQINAIFKVKVYVQDVCTKCGSITKRK